MRVERVGAAPRQQAHEQHVRVGQLAADCAHGEQDPGQGPGAQAGKQRVRGLLQGARLLARKAQARSGLAPCSQPNGGAGVRGRSEHPIACLPAAQQAPHLWRAPSAALKMPGSPSSDAAARSFVPIRMTMSCIGERRRAALIPPIGARRAGSSGASAQAHSSSNSGLLPSTASERLPADLGLVLLWQLAVLNPVQEVGSLVTCTTRAFGPESLSPSGVPAASCSSH